jgi:hypothetical protein
MNQVVQSFVKKPSSAIASLFSRLNTPPKYRVGYESKMSNAVNANKTLGKATSEHDSVEAGIVAMRENLDQVFQTWLEGDRDKELTIQVVMSANKEAQSLTITLPPPISFKPAEEQAQQ